MRTITKFVCVLFVAFVFSSCITVQNVPIDQMESGKVTLPANIRKIALIARNFKFSVDTLAGYYNLNFHLKKGLAKDNKLIDSVAVARSIDQLRKALLESGRFDEVFVYPVNAITPHIGEKELPLSQSFIQSLCNESETEAVISLEMLSYFYSSHKGSEGGELMAEANVKITAIWSVYTPSGNEPIDRYTHYQVIRWNEYDPNNIEKRLQLPDRFDAVSSAASLAAKNYSKRIVPHWNESSRHIIGLNGLDWDKALIYARKNKWNEAAAIWNKLGNSSQKRVAGVAALDLAVAQEMLGDIGQATTLSDKSVLLLQSGETGRIAREYAAILYQRKLITNKLDSLLLNGKP
jgi:hypothetical protein